MRKLTLMTSLLLALVLTTAGCGGEDSTAAYDRNSGQHQQDLAWGDAGDTEPGRYAADESGRLGDDRRDLGRDAKDAGRDLKDAAEEAGDGVRDALDDAKNGAKDAMDDMKDTMDGTGTAAGGQGKDPNVNAGNSSNPSVN